jgi:hypothetical protein
MLVADEVLLELSFPAAADRLTEVARGGWLARVSQGAYGDGRTGLVRVGPLGAAPGISKLAEVHLLDVAVRGESAVLALRWQATGPGGRLFPALDADLLLTPPGNTPPGCRWPGPTGRRPALWARAWTGDLPQGGRGDGAVPAGPCRGRSQPPPGPGQRRAV